MQQQKLTAFYGAIFANKHSQSAADVQFLLDFKHFGLFYQQEKKETELLFKNKKKNKLLWLQINIFQHNGSHDATTHSISWLYSVAAMLFIQSANRSVEWKKHSVLH